MIENSDQYEAAISELRDLEARLSRLQLEHPNPELGLTKVGVRKMIARLHEELGVYEAELSISVARDKHPIETSQ